MKRSGILGMAVAMMLSIGLLTGCGGDTKPAAAEKAKPKIGVIQLVEHPALDAANKGFVDGLASRGFKDKETVVIDQQNAQADQSNLNTIAQRFVSNKEDLILAIATPSAQAMANATKNIPILGTAITDYETAKLVQSNEKPGGNVTGTTDKSSTRDHIDLVLRFLPQAKTIGIVYSSSEINSQIQVEEARKYAAEKGLTIREATVSNVNDIQQAAQNLLTQGVDAFYVPTDNVVASAAANLVAVADSDKVPVFVAESTLLPAGGIASMSVDYYQLGFQTGLMAADILEGKSKPADMPIQAQKELQLAINEAKAAELGVAVPK